MAPNDTHFNEAKRELDKEFAADKDYKPKASILKNVFKHLNKCLKNVFKHLYGYIEFYFVCLLMVVCTSLTLLWTTRCTSRNNKAFEALRLPPCASHDWQLIATSVMWTPTRDVILSNNLSYSRTNFTALTIDADGAVKLSSTELASTSDIGEAYFKCIVHSQLTQILEK